MPTFNRFKKHSNLIEESVECFLRQDYQDKELIICNDAPEQKLAINHPAIKVLNIKERFKTLSDKIQYMIDNSNGDLLCRWDDDDISLPHRLSYSANKLAESELLEWRAANYYWDTGTLREITFPGNTHIMSLWNRKVLLSSPFNGKYPPKRSGDEDQLFNTYLQPLEAAGKSKCEEIPKEDIYYLYRWGEGSKHLSGAGAGDALQTHYDKLGTLDCDAGWYGIAPRWYQNHISRVQQHLRLPNEVSAESQSQLAGYFDFHRLYDSAVERVPAGGKIVEVGSLYGKSLIYLANKAKEVGKHIQIISVDLGIGVGDDKGKFGQDFHDTQTLLRNVYSAGIHDIASIYIGESSRVAASFVDESLDFVMLDDAHDYQSVRTNLQAWIPKIKRGGTIAGHDYIHPHYPGVKQAVDEFFSGPCHSQYCESCWEFVKH